MKTWDEAFFEREAWRRQVGENSARMAFAWGTSLTTGQGGIAHQETIEFGLAFAEKPMFSYGFELLNRTDFESDDGTGFGPQPPVSSGMVYDWAIDGRNMYVGAFVAVFVVCDDDIEIEHHFGFTGLAIKDFGSPAKL